MTSYEYRPPSETSLAALRRLYASTDPCGEPVRKEVEARTLLFPVFYALDERQFEAVAAAAADVGTRACVLFDLEGDIVDSSSWPRRAATLTSLESYADYRALTGPWEAALIDAGGQWGILISREGHAIVAGKTAFVEALTARFPEAGADVLPEPIKKSAPVLPRDQPQAFAVQVLWLARELGTDAAWLKPLLANIFGARADTILSSACTIVREHSRA